MGTLAFNNMSGIGRGGTGVLKVDGKEVATQKMEHTLPLILQWDETFDIGSDTGTPVDDQDYQVPVRLHRQAQQADAEDRPAAVDARGHQETRSGPAEQQGQRVTQTANATAGPVPAERTFDHYQRRQSPISPPSACRPPGLEAGRAARGGWREYTTGDASVVAEHRSTGDHGYMVPGAVGAFAV